MPYLCHSRNHGLWANVSSCLRFAAEMSLAQIGLMSGASNISCSCSMSSIMRSTSIPSQYLTERRVRSIRNGISNDRDSTVRHRGDHNPATGCSASCGRVLFDPTRMMPAKIITDRTGWLRSQCSILSRRVCSRSGGLCIRDLPFVVSETMRGNFESRRSKRRRIAKDRHSER
jgi:hypothetical protein